MNELNIVESGKAFLPVILGTDWNVYAVAASFHSFYGIDSVAIGMRRQTYTDNLTFLTVNTFVDFDQDKTFVKTLLDFASRNPEKKLLLIACSDYYAGLIINNAAVLRPFYYFNTISPALRAQLENKKDFYRTCEKYGLPYPKTFYIDVNNYKDFQLPFTFPVIAKPNDSIKWFNIKFEGYKKAYVLNDLPELQDTLEKVYANGYDDVFIIQEYIPGGTDKMFVVNAYVNREGKIWMTHGAQTALDEILPNDIGNYNALISGSFPSLTQGVKDFLQKIAYRGFANFDFKYDERDKTYKVFEINLRLGRSSYYMTVSGNNYAQYLVDDLIYERERVYLDFTEEHLWYVTSKSVLRKYCAPVLAQKVNELLSQGKATYHLSYYANKNIKRLMLALRRKISTRRYYPKYLEEK